MGLLMFKWNERRRPITDRGRWIWGLGCVISMQETKPQTDTRHRVLSSERNQQLHTYIVHFLRFGEYRIGKILGQEFIYRYIDIYI